MATTIDAPLQWVENVATLRLPEQADRHLQQLMDRNNEGLLTDQERKELAALAELSEHPPRTERSLQRVSKRFF